MRVEVERTGGFAGRVVRWSVDVADLPPPAGEEVVALLASARSWGDGADPEPGTGADRFRWRLLTSGFPEDVDLVFGEPAPEPARRLVDLVREAPGRS